MELLNGLQNAAKLFEQKENVIAEYNSLKRKDRPYEEKRKMGFVGKAVLVLEILYSLYWIAAALYGMQYYVPTGTMDEQSEIKIIYAGIVMLAIVAIVVIVATYIVCRVYNKKRNKRIARDNAELRIIKSAIKDRREELEEAYTLIESRIDRYVSAWYPEGYESSRIAAYFYSVIKNGRANTLGEAINLYEDELYRRQQQEANERMYEETRKQTLMQGVQIAEQATMIAQLKKANQQLEEQNRRLQNSKK